MGTDRNLLTQRYLTVLNEELGWGATADDQGDIKFSTPNGSLVWILNHAPTDPEYLRMYLGFRLSSLLEQTDASLNLKLIEDRLKLANFTNFLTRRSKGVKVTTAAHNDALEFSVEAIVAGPDRMPSVEHLAVILPRMLNMLLAACRRFQQEVTLAKLDPGEVEQHENDEIGQPLDSP